MIEPIFEEIAGAKAQSGKIAFAKIDLDVGMGRHVAGEYGVRVTPTFVFYLDGKKVCLYFRCRKVVVLILFIHRRMN